MIANGIPSTTLTAPVPTSCIDRAFELGSQARHDAQPLARNPYPAENRWAEHKYWISGWRFCDVNWGVDVKGRWFFWPLRDVKLADVTGGPGA